MKILFLQKRILFPADVGNKIRTLNVVRHLAQWHDITYLCNLQPGEEEFVPQMEQLGLRLETIPWTEVRRGSWRFYRDLAINVASRYPFNVNKDFDRRLRARAVELLREQPFDLVICDFVQMARNALGLESPASLLFQHNVEAEIFKRHAHADGSWLRKQYMRMQWRKMQRFEGAAGRRFDRVIAVSDRDRDIFEKEYGWTHVDVINTAVDLEFFRPAPSAEVADRVVFLGSLDWLPNEDGVIHFVERVWPAIRRQRPAATFHVVGRNPSPSIRRLRQQAGVTIVGTVPDVRPHVAEAAVFVVPLLVGGGTRLKIFEAMAMRKAVVSTTLGAEGLPVESGRHLVIADDPETFSKQVIRLLADAEARDGLAEESLRLVQARFSAESVAREFERICLQASGVANDPVELETVG